MPRAAALMPAVPTLAAVLPARALRWAVSSPVPLLQAATTNATVGVPPTGVVFALNLPWVDQAREGIAEEMQAVGYSKVHRCAAVQLELRCRM